MPENINNYENIGKNETNTNKPKSIQLTKEDFESIKQEFNNNFNKILPNLEEINTQSKKNAFEEQMSKAITESIQKTFPKQPEKQFMALRYLVAMSDKVINEKYNIIIEKSHEISFEKQISEMNNTEINELNAFIKNQIGSEIMKNPEDVIIQIYVQSSPEWSQFGENMPLNSNELIEQNKNLSNNRIAEYKNQLQIVLEKKGIPKAEINTYINNAEIIIDNTEALQAAINAGYKTNGDIPEDFAKQYRNARIGLKSKNKKFIPELKIENILKQMAPPEEIAHFSEYSDVLLMVDISPSMQKIEDAGQRRNNQAEAAKKLEYLGLYANTGAKIPTINLGTFSYENEVAKTTEISQTRDDFYKAGEKIENIKPPHTVDNIYKETGVASSLVAFKKLNKNPETSLIHILTDEGEYLNAESKEEAIIKAKKLLNKVKESGVTLVIGKPREKSSDFEKDLYIKNITEEQITNMIDEAEEGGWEINWWKNKL